MDTTGPDSVLARAAGPAALAVLFLGLLVWSFGRWADVHIDFGNELYIAWRLSEGDALYRDIAHRNGPFSHYVNALLFRVLGVSLRTLVIANLCVLAAICAMSWRLFARACDRATATLCVAVLLAVFAFGQYAVIGNFNYVTPYMHAQTHGLALGLALLLCLDAAGRRAARGGLLGAGVCLGALFLTKAELFVPALAVVAVAFLARRRGTWRADAGAVGDALWLLAGACVPIAGFALLLATRMPVSLALTGLAGNWAYLSDVGSDAFYLQGAGLDDPRGRAGRIAGVGAALAFVLLGVAALDRSFEVAQRRMRAGPWARRACSRALATLALLGLVVAPIAWARAALLLPLFALASVGWLAWRLQPAAAGELRRRRFGLLLLGVYALLLLAKSGLAARFDHYGFVLAMPATLLGVAALVHAYPAWLHARYGGGALARSLGVALVLAATLSLWSISARLYAGKTFPIGRGADALLASGPQSGPRAALLAQTLAFLEQRMAPGETLVVMPDGMLLNYWMRARNPSRFLIFLPTEIRAFGESAMLADLAAHPPDYVVLVHRLWREFGVGPFGKDPRNGRALRRWVDANYRRLRRFGAEPFGSQGFGSVVLMRNEPATRRAAP